MAPRVYLIIEKRGAMLQEAVVKPFAVHSRARPLRIASLIDPSECPHHLLDSIFAWNYGLWGGRYNPIIPVASGAISDSYWQLLRFVDPDVIHAYTNLSPDLIQRLDLELCPTRIDHLDWKRFPGSTFHTISLHHEQSSISAVFHLALERHRFGSRKPRLLTSTAKFDWPHRRQVFRNFGLFDERIGHKPYSEDQDRIVIEDDWTEERVLQELSQMPYGIVFPFQASEVNAEFPEADHSHLYDYCLVLGDDVQEWVYFWNRIFLLSESRRSGWHTLCVSPERLSREEYRDAIRRFLNQFGHGGGSRAALVGLVSFTLSLDDLNQIRKDLFTTKLHLVPRVEQLQANEYPPISKAHRSFPEFDRSGFHIPSRDVTMRQQVSARKSLLKIPESEARLGQGNWVMDLRIERIPEHNFNNNEITWWMLPRRRELAKLFVHGLPTRISADHSISTEMRGQKTFELSVPDDSTVLRLALGAGAQSRWSDGFHPTRQRPPYEDIVVSDKGRYTSGVLALFGGLEQAGTFLENAFWRGVVERLAKRNASVEAETLARIRNKLMKRRPILMDAGSGREEAVNYLSRYILNLARHQHVSDEDIAYDVLRKLFHDQRQDFIAKNPDFQNDASEAGVNSDREQATRWLQRRVQSLTDGRVLLQGIRLHCGSCGSNYWEEVGELKQSSKCRGCGGVVSLPTEATWRYRLNTLVRNAVAFHGCVPVILTLHQLRQFRTRHSFVYAPGFSLYRDYDDATPAAELDLVCISDGKLMVGEVKTSCDEFIERELAKLADLARTFRADVAVLGCFLDQNRRIEEKKTALKSLLNGTHCEVRTVLPHGHAFEPTPYP